MTAIGPISAGRLYPRTLLGALLDTPGLLRYYRCTEQYGTAAIDSNGLAWGPSDPGTYYGSPTLGVPGGLVGCNDTAFTSASGKRMDGTSGITAITNWTIGALVLPSSLSSNGVMVHVGGTVGMIEISEGDGGGGSGAHLELIAMGVAYIDTGWLFPDTTTWRFVVVTRDTSTIYVDVDGVQVATSVSIPNAPDSTLLRLGDDGTGGHPWAGSIHSVFTANRALTPLERVTLARIRAGNWAP
jgi:hypothetical protein